MASAARIIWIRFTTNLLTFSPLAKNGGAACGVYLVLRERDLLDLTASILGLEAMVFYREAKSFQSFDDPRAKRGRDPEEAPADRSSLRSTPRLSRAPWVASVAAGPPRGVTLPLQAAAVLPSSGEPLLQVQEEPPPREEAPRREE